MSRTRQKKATQHIAIRSSGKTFFQNLVQWSIELLVRIQYAWFKEELTDRPRNECLTLRSCLHSSCILQEQESVTESNGKVIESTSPLASGMDIYVIAEKTRALPINDIHHYSEKQQKPQAVQAKLFFFCLPFLFPIYFSKVSTFSLKLTDQVFLLGQLSTRFIWS